MCRHIGEYISLKLFYFVNLTRSCSLTPSLLCRYFPACFMFWQNMFQPDTVDWALKISYLSITACALLQGCGSFVRRQHRHNCSRSSAGERFGSWRTPGAFYRDRERPTGWHRWADQTGVWAWSEVKQITSVPSLLWPWGFRDDMTKCGTGLTPSLHDVTWKWPIKVQNLKSFNFFVFFFCTGFGKRFSSKHIALKGDVTWPENRLFLRYICASFSPEILPAGAVKALTRRGLTGWELP